MTKKILLMTLGMSLFFQVAKAENDVEEFAKFLNFLPPGHYTGHASTNPNIECSVNVVKTQDGDIFISAQNRYDEISHIIYKNKIENDNYRVSYSDVFNHVLIEDNIGNPNYDPESREIAIRVTKSSETFEVFFTVDIERNNKRTSTKIICELN